MLGLALKYPRRSPDCTHFAFAASSRRFGGRTRTTTLTLVPVPAVAAGLVRFLAQLRRPPGVRPPGRTLARGDPILDLTGDRTDRPLRGSPIVPESLEWIINHLFLFWKDGKQILAQCDSLTWYGNLAWLFWRMKWLSVHLHHKTMY